MLHQSIGRGDGSQLGAARHGPRWLVCAQRVPCSEIASPGAARRGQRWRLAPSGTARGDLTGVVGGFPIVQYPTEHLLMMGWREWGDVLRGGQGRNRGRRGGEGGGRVGRMALPCRWARVLVSSATLGMTCAAGGMTCAVVGSETRRYRGQLRAWGDGRWRGLPPVVTPILTFPLRGGRDLLQRPLQRVAPHVGEAGEGHVERGGGGAPFLAFPCRG